MRRITALSDCAEKFAAKILTLSHRAKKFVIELQFVQLFRIISGKMPNFVAQYQNMCEGEYNFQFCTTVQKFF